VLNSPYQELAKILFPVLKSAERHHNNVENGKEKVADKMVGCWVKYQTFYLTLMSDEKCDGYDMRQQRNTKQNSKYDCSCICSCVTAASVGSCSYPWSENNNMTIMHLICSATGR
jgi:hypothetical protein